MISVNKGLFFSNRRMETRMTKPRNKLSWCVLSPWGAVESARGYGWGPFHHVTLSITNDRLLGACKAAASHGLPG